MRLGSLWRRLGRSRVSLGVRLEGVLWAGRGKVKMEFGGDCIDRILERVL